tara:strand:- start:527 stop:697 length:171 start_codon:yes stop_codon:yes gene_type:complete
MACLSGVPGFNSTTWTAWQQVGSDKIPDFCPFRNEDFTNYMKSAEREYVIIAKGLI